MTRGHNRPRGPRIWQTVECCGLLYKRWRSPEGQFPMGHTHCCRCEKKLRWPRSFVAGNQAAAARYYSRRVKHYGDLGLTSRGTPRRRRPNGCPKSLEVLRRDNLACYQARAARFARQGLTTRGTAPKRGAHKPARMSDQEWAYRQFREGIEARLPDYFDHQRICERKLEAA